MKSIVWFILPLSLATVACEKRDLDLEEAIDRSACSVDNPVADLAWLKETIAHNEQMDKNENTQYEYIAQADYEGETVFIQGNCCPLCNSVSAVVDCAGELLGFLGGGEGDIDFSILENAIIIWKPEGGVCTLNE